MKNRLFMVKDFNKIYPYIVGLLFFLQVSFPKLMPISLIIWLIYAVIGVFKKKLIWKIDVVSILFILFYTAYFVGIFFTKDEALAKSYLEYKLSFIIFPILISLRPKEKFSLEIPSIFFISSLILYSFYSIIKLFLCLKEGSFTTCISYFSSLHHPTYYASYLFVGVILAIFGYNQKWKFFTKLNVILFSIFAVVCYFLTVSMAAFLFLLIILVGVVWIWIKNKFGVKLTLIVSLLLILILSCVVYLTPLKNDFKQTYGSVSNYLISPSDFLHNANRNLSGNEIRLVLWTVTLENINENPFGVGTASADFYTNKKLEKYNLPDVASLNYNPHNQFLHVFLEIGIFGFIIFCSIFIITIVKSIKDKNWLLLLIVLNLAFNSLFESMLQRQSGIVFFTCMICFLYTHVFKNSQNEIVNE